MHKVIIPDAAPEYCLIMDETKKICFNFMPIAEQQKAQNIADALNAVQIFGKDIETLINERINAINDLKYVVEKLKSIAKIYDWETDAAGKIAHETLQAIGESF